MIFILDQLEFNDSNSYQLLGSSVLHWSEFLNFVTKFKFCFVWMDNQNTETLSQIKRCIYIIKKSSSICNSYIKGQILLLSYVILQNTACVVQ